MARKTVFLNGGSLIGPLFSAFFYGAASYLTWISPHTTASHELLLNTLFGLGFLASLSLAAVCKTNFSRRLGRTKIPQLLPIFGTEALLAGLVVSSGTSDQTVVQIAGLFFCLSLLPVSWMILRLFDYSYYIERDGEMTFHGFMQPVSTNPYDALQYVCEANLMESGSILKQRNFIDSQNVFETEPNSLLWNAWIPGKEFIIQVIGSNVESARQFAARIMGQSPDTIVVYPRDNQDTHKALAIRQGIMDKLELYDQQEREKRRLVILQAAQEAQAAIYFSSHIPALENHATQMDKAFIDVIAVKTVSNSLNEI
jgi:hypothetical protein